MEVFTNNWNSRKYQIGYALSGGFIKGFTRMATSHTKYLIISPDINSRI